MSLAAESWARLVMSTELAVAGSAPWVATSDWIPEGKFVISALLCL